MIRYGTPGADRIRIDLVDGTRDSVYGRSGDDVLVAQGSNDEGSELYGGPGNDVLRGGDDSQGLRGYAWTFLDGGAGVDTMVGGIGEDWFYVDSRKDVVRDLTLGDSDLVFSSAKFFQLPDNVERLFMDWRTTEENLSARGNSLANDMVGLDETADRLVGLGGNDTLDGGGFEFGHADTLIGGMGADFLQGSPDAIFKYNRTIESDGTHGVDTIRFMGPRALIDLSKIDANAATAGLNDSFAFIGTDAFSADATGQIRYEMLSEWQARIYISTDADPEAEMEIISATYENSYRVPPPSADDFIL